MDLGWHHHQDILTGTGVRSLTLSHYLSASLFVEGERVRRREENEKGGTQERESVWVCLGVCVAHRVERRKLCLNFFSLFNPCLISPFSFSVSLSLFFQSLSRLTQVYACCAYLWQSSTSVIWFVVPPSSTAIYSNSNVPTSFKPFWLKISNKKSLPSTSSFLSFASTVRIVKIPSASSS